MRNAIEIIRIFGIFRKKSVMRSCDPHRYSVCVSATIEKVCCHTGGLDVHRSHDMLKLKCFAAEYFLNG